MGSMECLDELRLADGTRALSSEQAGSLIIDPSGSIARADVPEADAGIGRRKLCL